MPGATRPSERASPLTVVGPEIEKYGESGGTTRTRRATLSLLSSVRHPVTSLKGANSRNCSRDGRGANKGTSTGTAVAT